MKSFLLIGIVFSFELMAATCPQSSVDLAQKLYNSVNAGFQRGLFSEDAVIKASVTLLDAKFCADQLSQKDYCDSKMTALSKLETVYAKVLNSGMPTRAYDGLPSVYRQLAELHSHCN